MKEGDRFPELAEAFGENIVAGSMRFAVAWIKRQGRRAGVDVEDPEALAEVMIGALVGYTLQEVIVGGPTTGIDDERFLAAWTRSVIAIVEATIDSRSHANA
jgi:hypothetical protein